MDAKSLGIRIYGLFSDQCLPIVESLLSRELPNGWEWVSSSDYAVVARSNTHQGIYYKEFLPRSSFEGLKAFFRGSRSERAARNGELLISKGLHSPAILCRGESGQSSFMITEAVDGIGITYYIAANWRRPFSKQGLILKRRLITMLGAEIGRMHKAGIVHGDLRPNNVLVQNNDSDTIFHLIDNESNRCFRKIPLRLVEKNLVQLGFLDPLHVTIQDRLRFFRAYCAEYNRFSESEAIALMKRVRQKSIKRLRKRVRRMTVID